MGATLDTVPPVKQEDTAPRIFRYDSAHGVDWGVRWGCASTPEIPRVAIVLPNEHAARRVEAALRAVWVSDDDPGDRYLILLLLHMNQVALEEE